MSPSADHGTGSTNDAGFSLIEVVVSIGILMMVTVALLPQLVLGVQATGTARTVTQAKGVAQGQLENMRNLPYYISPEAGDFRDVLDTYYRNQTPPSTTPVCTTTSGRYALPQTGWTGYIPAAAPLATRCDYGPTGAFYRRVTQGTATPGSPTPMIVVDTRFLSGVRPGESVTPSSSYNSQSITASQPASSQIGVTVTVVYIERGGVRATATSTQISDRPATVERIRAESNVTAVEMGSEITGKGPVSLSAGVLHLAGSLTYASTVNASLAGTSASVATGEQAGGATATVAAPPNTTTEVRNENQGSLTGACVTACWGTTRVTVPSMTANGGLPQAGSQAAPMQALLTDKGGHDGFSFGNSTSTAYRPGLRLTPPLVRLNSGATTTSSGVAAGCNPGGGATESYVTAGGYLRSSFETVLEVETCAVARASKVSLFPTEFAPQGVVVVELTQAKAQCTVTGASHTASVSRDYSAVVSYWDGTAYVALPTISPGMASDPLDAVHLATTPVGGGLFLGDFVDSWSALRGTEIVSKTTGGVAEIKLPGVVTVASKATRPGTVAGLDPTSVVSVTVGALSCAAEDQR